MAKDLHNKAQDKVEPSAEARLESERRQAREKIAGETNETEALSILKAHDEKIAKNDAHLPKVEIVNGKKTEGSSKGETAEAGRSVEPEKKAEPEPAANEAERLEKALRENHSLSGRSNANIERDLRDTFATLSGDGVSKLQTDYQKHFGKSLTETINSDKNISPETKAALAIYMKGAEHRSDKDTLALADIATKSGNLDMFKETFREASGEARKQYIEQGGIAHVEEAFHSKDKEQALEYLAQGKESTITKIKESSGNLNDNEKAIEAALKGMSKAERQDYAEGKALAETLSARGKETDTSNLTEAQKQSYENYKQLNGALHKAGNAGEVLAWEDLISNKEQTLTGKLSSHGGILFNDSVDKVQTDIENMSRSDFEKLKTDPEQRKAANQAIEANYKGSEREKIEDLLNMKLSFDTFEEAQAKGNRTTVESITDKQGTIKPDDEGILASLKKMTVEEQERYRHDPDYKKQIDSLVDGVFHNRVPEVDAQRILQNVEKGEKPTEDIVGKLSLQVYGQSRDKATALKDIEDALKADGTLAQRLKNPQGEEEKATAAKFKQYAEDVFGADYENLVQPLLTEGDLPLSKKIAVNDGLLKADMEAVAEAIKSATAQERAQLAANPDSIMPSLNADERQVALTIAAHGGEIRPEDRMRIALLGISGDKETIKELSGQLTVEERQKLVGEYESQYHRKLVEDLGDKLGGQDEIEAVRAFKGLLANARESFNEARSEEYENNDGIGRKLVRNYVDGTADAERDALNQYASAMTSYAREQQEMPREEVHARKEDLHQAGDLLRESKNQAADIVTDGTIIAAGIAAAPFTGGASVELLGATAMAGSVIKVGTKSIIMGDDYHAEAPQLLHDATSGAVEGASAVLGPAHMASLLKLDRTASGSVLRKTLEETGLNAGAGTLAGGSSGLVEGAGNWDTNKPLDTNLKQVGEATLMGSAMGGTLGAGIGLGFKSLDNVLKKSSETLIPEAPHIYENPSPYSLDSNGRIAQINGATSVKVSYHESGALEGAVQKIEIADGTSYEALGEGKWKLTDGNNPQGQEVEAAISLSHKGEIQIKSADGNTKTISPIEGWTREFHRAIGETSLMDSQGRLLSHEARNGHGTRYQYDEQGKLSQIDFDNGNSITWQAEGKSWLIRNSQGKESRTFHGEVALDADGNIRLKPDGNETLATESHPNQGQEQIFRKDGSYSHIDPVTGKPSDLVSADGTRRESYEYAADGTLHKLTFGNGAYLLRNPDDSSAMLQYNSAGKLTNDLYSSVQIEANGAQIESYGTKELVTLTDGTLIQRTTLGHKVLGEQLPRNMHDPATVNDTAGLKHIQTAFASTTRIDSPQTIHEASKSLKGVDIISADGNKTNVYDSLMRSEVLSDVQKENILRNYARMREYDIAPPKADLWKTVNDEYRTAATSAPSEATALNTPAAIAKTIEVAKSNGLSAVETEDAVLASIYSHALHGKQAPIEASARKAEAAPVDAAQAAEFALTQDGLSAQRVGRIVDAIKMHNTGETLDTIKHGQAYKQLSNTERREMDELRRIFGTIDEGAELSQKAINEGSVARLEPTSKTDLATLETRPFHFPGISPEEIKAGKVWESSDGLLKAWRSEDTNLLHVLDTEKHMMRTFDNNNRLLVVHGANYSREMQYNADGTIKSVKMKNPGEEEYSTVKAGFGKEISVDAEGTVRVLNEKFAGTELESHYIDGSVEKLLPSGRTEYVKANLDFEKERLNSTFQTAFANTEEYPNRLERVTSYMEYFEREAASAERNLDQNSQALVYKQLNRLISESPNSVMPLAQRLDVAEQALQHSAYPETVGQGRNNTCNVTVLEHRIYWRTPDKNIQALADIGQTGKFTLASGIEVNLLNAEGRLPMDYASKQNLLRQGLGATHRLKTEGTRDYSSELLQTTMVNAQWAKETVMVDGEGRWLSLDDKTMRYNQEGSAIGVLRKEDLKTPLDAEGNQVTSIEPGTELYRLGEKLEGWQAIYSKEGVLQGIVEDSNKLRPVFDVTGKKVETDLGTDVASGKYFDENGKLLAASTHHGDIHYTKLQVREGREAERLMVQIGGEAKELKTTAGLPISSPSLGAPELLSIHNEITGLQDKPFILSYAVKDHKVINFQSEEEMVSAIRKLEAENNLPGVLAVDATRPPYNRAPNFGETGESQNWHVVNIHGLVEDSHSVNMPGYDIPSRTNTLGTNQWGLHNNESTSITGETTNSLADGISSETVFQSAVPSEPNLLAPFPGMSHAQSLKLLEQKMEKLYGKSNLSLAPLPEE
ncbi:MAG: hypothetical protein IPK73_18035 [Candidatus Obscuribacter sp.]|nr:hypothetical protein [Candidatus Obscuribacter sp.]MBK9278472.1 hypothetical protein [Candidatus Obscuribacter sp.]